MAGLKYYERTKLLIELIEKKKTGGPSKLAKKLQVHKRTVYRILDDLRFSSTHEITYCKESNSYVFFRKKLIG
jgi:DNA-binding IclR family transcriptional regulator